jgi:hypothetical protein
MVCYTVRRKIITLDTHLQAQRQLKQATGYAVHLLMINFVCMPYEVQHSTRDFFTYTVLTAAAAVLTYLAPRCWLRTMPQLQKQHI